MHYLTTMRLDLSKAQLNSAKFNLEAAKDELKNSFNTLELCKSSLESFNKDLMALLNEYA